MSHLRHLKSPWLLVLLLPLLVLFFDPTAFTGIVTDAVSSFVGTLPFIFFAVALVAYLKAAGAETMIAAAFKGREVSTIVLAALFGGLAPFCSCEVIPFIAALLSLGAPLSAVMAFWLSSPLIDPPTLLITAGGLGWDFTIAKTLSAVAVGLMGGYFVMGLQCTGAWQDVLKPTPATGCGCGPDPLSGKPKWAFWQDDTRIEIFQREGWSNLLFLIKWLVLAYVLEALMIHYIPAEWIANAVGGTGIFPIVIAALVGMPAYLNGYVAVPLLSGLMEQGMSPGAALSFMVAGAVSSIPAMAAVWSLVKPRVFAAYVGLGFLGAIFWGLAFQAVAMS